MPALTDFPSTARWAARHPERIQLYSLNTPNGVKVSIMLEECGLAYQPHLVDIGKGESRAPAFLSLNPNGACATRNRPRDTDRGSGANPPRCEMRAIGRSKTRQSADTLIVNLAVHK